MGPTFSAAGHLDHGGIRFPDLIPILSAHDGAAKPSQKTDFTMQFTLW
jgi:hypothetical protein